MRSEIIRLGYRQLTIEWHHGTSRKRLIVACHGYWGSSEDPTIVAIATGLNEASHDTVTFNFSKNTGGFDIEHQMQDIAHIVEFFRDYEEIILFATSLGALTAAIATIQITKVKGLITLNGFFGGGQLGQTHRKNYLKFRAAALVIPKYRGILKFYEGRLQPALIETPTLVIHSKADKYVYIVQSRTFYDQLTSPKQFVELRTANHGVTSPKDREKVITVINNWLDNI